MNLRKALDILKYYGNCTLNNYLRGYTSYDLKSMMDLEEAIDEVRDFILSMEDK